MTRRCAYCTPKHIIGPDMGPPYTDGYCRLAYFKESISILVHYELPAFFQSRVLPLLRRAENLFWQLALVYLLLQILRWSLNDFAIVGK